MSTQEPQMPEPDGWVTMWPAMRGGHRPVYCLGAEKPSYGDELDAMLNVYPVYKAATTLAYAEALAAHRVAQAVAAKQAEIDRLMLEWCPEEMSPEQLAEWTENQRSIQTEPGKEPT